MTADWIAALLILGSLAVIALLIVHHLAERIDADEPVPYLPVDRDAEWDRHVAAAIAHPAIFWMGSVFSFLGLVALVAGCLYGYYPYDSTYHQYREVDGTVDRITSRLVSAGDNGGSNQKYVVVFRGSPQQYAIEDTRASLVRPGDTITISCIRAFEYGSTDGYDCNWGKP